MLAKGGNDEKSLLTWYAICNTTTTVVVGGKVPLKDYALHKSETKMQDVVSSHQIWSLNPQNLRP